MTGWGWHLLAGVVSLSVVLFAELPLFGQIAPEQKLTEAYRLEREGKAAPAIVQLKLLLDSKTLDGAGVGKAWDVLGLAFEDQGDFSASRHAFEESIEAYHAVPNDTSDEAMALDDFGELYVATGQLDLAVRTMERALDIYEAANDHAGVARASSDLAGALLSEKKIREGRKNLDRAVKESRLTNKLGDDDLATLASLQGWLAQCDGDLPVAVSKYQQSLDLLRQFHGEENASTGWGYVLLGRAEAETGDLRGSLAEMVKGVAILGRTLNREDPRFLSAEIAYSRVLDKVGKRSEADAIRASAEEQLRTFRSSQCVDCTISATAFR
ncbi:MAG TPA: tetratricopeptide repeat protein [Terracidiphilus sp.]|nr:tetratricopeptide repeat protein [Terracidiphilus sp.]